jgi:hypothetical protein
MAEPLILTFAELEFVLRARPERAEAVRADLRLNPEASTDIVVAAGVASLLARGLCTLSGTDVAPTAPLAAVMVALSTGGTHVEAVGWRGERMVLVHLYAGGSVGLVMQPAAYGQFSVELLRPDEPLAAPVTRFLDSCTAGEGEAAVAVRLTTGDAAELSLAIARDGAGAWFVSDSLESPDKGVPTSRDGVVQRLTDLLGPQSVGARR